MLAIWYTCSGSERFCDILALCHTFYIIFWLNKIPSYHANIQFAFNTQELLFLPMKNRTSSHSNFWSLPLVFSPRDIYYRRRKKITIKTLMKLLWFRFLVAETFLGLSFITVNQSKCRPTFNVTARSYGVIILTRSWRYIYHLLAFLLTYLLSFMTQK